MSQDSSSVEFDKSNLLLEKNLIIGDPASNVGVCTLWTKHSLIAEHLDKDSFFICANLYSIAGIEIMLRNVLAYPQIRYLVLCGADLSKTGEIVVRLFTEGLAAAKNYNITLPEDCIVQLLEAVQLIDLRNITSRKPQTIAESIRAITTNLTALPPFAKPQVFPKSNPNPNKPLSNEGSGFRVEESNIAETWLELLRLVMRFGAIKPTDYNQGQRELLNTIAVINDTDIGDASLATWLPFSKADLDDYYIKMFSSEKVEGVSYSYGERLRKFDGSLDQIELLKARLNENSFTRRAIAVTWDVRCDSNSDNPPCLLEITAAVQHENLYLTAVFRSHDIFNAWPQNAFALRRFHIELSQDMNLGLGSLAIVSHSAHIYEGQWQRADEVVEQSRALAKTWKSDPRGYFLINVESGEEGQPKRIIVQHCTIEGPSSYYFEGVDGSVIYRRIAREKLVSREEHFLYLGYELMKAQIALNLGIEYIQDQKLSFGA